jgi:hypothetical protein
MMSACVFAEQQTPSYEASGKRDPFVSLIASAAMEASGLLGVETADDLTVEGIAYDPVAGSMVIVNGVALKEGEGAGSVKVVEIRPEGVVFLIGETETFKSVREAGAGLESG